MRCEAELRRNQPLEPQRIPRRGETDRGGTRTQGEGLVLEDEPSCGWADEPPNLPRRTREGHVPPEDSRLRQVDDERRVDRAVQAHAEGEDCYGNTEDERGLRAGEPTAARHDGEKRPRPDDPHERQAAHPPPALDELHDRQLSERDGAGEDEPEDADRGLAHVREPAIGVLWFVFSGAVALGQLPIVKLVEGRRRMRGLALMGVVWAGTFLAVMAGGGWLTGPQAALVFGVAVAVFALGVCLHGAIYAPLVVDLAQPRILGRYMAFSSASWQIGWLIGPAAGGFVLQHEPLALWPGAAAICLAASGYALWLERLIPAQLRLTPHVDSLAGVPGTMANMAPATDEPLSTDAKPPTHQE